MMRYSNDLALLINEENIKKKKVSISAGKIIRWRIELCVYVLSSYSFLVSIDSWPLMLIKPSSTEGNSCTKPGLWQLFYIRLLCLRFWFCYFIRDFENSHFAWFFVILLLDTFFSRIYVYHCFKFVFFSRVNSVKK